MNVRRLPIGPILGLAVAVYLSFLLIDTVKKNYDLKQQIGDLQADITTLETENQELKYQTAYYQTDAFKEKEARAKLGLQAPGENVIILPKQQTAPEETEAQKKAKKKSNLQQWKEFLFG